jgi:spore maturation protein SpmA
MLAIRQSLNSKNPNNIIIPVWLATTVAATTGIIALKIFFRKR